MNREHSLKMIAILRRTGTMKKIERKKNTHEKQCHVEKREREKKRIKINERSKR